MYALIGSHTNLVLQKYDRSLFSNAVVLRLAIFDYSGSSEFVLTWKTTSRTAGKLVTSFCFVYAVFGVIKPMVFIHT